MNLSQFGILGNPKIIWYYWVLCYLPPHAIWLKGFCHAALTLIDCIIGSQVRRRTRRRRCDVNGLLSFGWFRSLGNYRYFPCLYCIESLITFCRQEMPKPNSHFIAIFLSTGLYKHHHHIVEMSQVLYSSQRNFLNVHEQQNYQFITRKLLTTSVAVAAALYYVSSTHMFKS